MENSDADLINKSLEDVQCVLNGEKTPFRIDMLDGVQFKDCAQDIERVNLIVEKGKVIGTFRG